MSNNENHHIQYINGTAVVNNNGFSVLAADGKLYLADGKYLGQFDSPTESPAHVLGQQEVKDNGICLVEHYLFWCRFKRPKTKS